MLSAIAARKAAQAERQELTGANDGAVATKTSLPSTETTPPSRPISKRKLSSQTPNSSRKKKKNVKRVAERRTRYFEEQDTFEKENDLIIIDSDEQDVSEDDLDVVLPPLSGDVPVTGKRRWSPSIPLKDSSEDEGDDEDVDADISFPIQPRPVADEAHPILSTFLPVPEQNTFFLTSDELTSLGLTYTGTSATVLAMAPTRTISLLGTYALTLIHGSISISGVTLLASRQTHRVFAPRSSPVPILECLAGNSTVSNSETIPDRIRPLLRNPGAVIVLQDLRTGIEGLGRICRTFDGVFEPSRWQKNDIQPHLRISGVHTLTHRSKEIQPFILPSSWQSALLSISSEDVNMSPGLYLVKGPKKSGKSTFARTLLNTLLTRYRKVAFLECDLGQSEFTPGGMVALNVIDRPIFGPPFSHPTLPNLAHYIGATTPRSSPSHYLTAIQDLVQSYRLDIQSPIVDASDDVEDIRISETIPLIINTMGWTKGLGADLSSKIEDIVEPTHIFEIEAPVYESGWSAPPPRLHPAMNENDTKLHLLEPILTSVLSTNYSPTDHRSLSILSYFHAIFPSHVQGELEQVTASSWDTSLPLCAHPPYEVNWALAFDKFVLVGSGTEDVVHSEIERVLNAAIVALVSCEPGTIDLDVDMLASASASPSGFAIPYIQGSSVPSPSTSRCHGLALIRSMSSTSSDMHVLTPLPPHFFAKCKVVVKGEMELPIWGMLDLKTDGNEEVDGVAGVEKSRVPYLQWGKGEGIGGERKRVRRNLMRKGQM